MSATEFLETVVGKRCPCGHLASHHRIPTRDEIAALPGLVLHECHECDCQGLIEWDDERG